MKIKIKTRKKTPAQGKEKPRVIKGDGNHIREGQPEE
jgi:hypothetical protein